MKKQSIKIPFTQSEIVLYLKRHFLNKENKIKLAKQAKKPRGGILQTQAFIPKLSFSKLQELM